MRCLEAYTYPYLRVGVPFHALPRTSGIVLFSSLVAVAVAVADAVGYGSHTICFI